MEVLNDRYMIKLSSPEEYLSFLGNRIMYLNTVFVSGKGKRKTHIQRDFEQLEEYLERKNNSDRWFFTSGFPELDDIIHGIQRLEEFLVIVARTNQGKSWVLEKIVTHIWQLGFNVGYISPEMRASSIGFRFDTL